MPRDLGEVLHYFIPEAGESGREGGAPEAIPERTPPPQTRAAELPVIGLPIGERDVLRAAFAWNLTVEAARLGARATLLAPEGDDASALWPPADHSPLGSQLCLQPCADLADLERAARELARDQKAASRGDGLILVRIPPAWLRHQARSDTLLRWLLLFTCADPRDLRETYGVAKLVLEGHAEARIGVTVHGARGISDAESAFARIAGAAYRHLGRDLTSYGLLVDDLHVYRAIVAQRPIGLAHPQSPAARALRDVAQLLLEDSRKPAHA